MSEPSIFRPEALEHHARPTAGGGPVRITPRWLGPVFWLILVAVIAGFLVSAFVRVGSESLLDVMVRTVT